MLNNAVIVQLFQAELVV